VLCHSFTNLLVPGDPDRVGKLIYVINVETSQSVQERHSFA